MSVRIATFNVENLMARFDFATWRKTKQENFLRRKHDIKERALLMAHEDDSRQMTSLAIADCHADIICLQEVEDLHTLEEFEKDYLAPITGLKYPHKVLIEGNDGRGIDVAFMAREKTADGETIEVLNAKSHKKHTFGSLGLFNSDLKAMGYNKDQRIFRRDCLEVDLRIGGKRMTVFVCHFKSMGTSRDGVEGRKYTMPVRFAEAKAVRRILEKKFGSERAPNMRWMICGDLNDYTERLVVAGDKHRGYKFVPKVEPESGLEPLFTDGFSVDLVKRREGDNRWTLYHEAGDAKNAREPEVREVRHLVQIDYLLSSPSLANGNLGALPHVVRHGQPMRTVFPPKQDVERYPRTGWDRPKASDHCPVAVTLKMV